AARRVLPLQSREVPGSVGYALSLPGLLLLHLPQDGGGRGLRHQPRGRRGHARGRGRGEPHRLQREALRPRRPGRDAGERGGAQLLPLLRERAVALLPEPPGPRPPARLRNGYALAQAAGARAHHAELRGALVRGPDWRGREALPGVSRRVSGRVAPASRASV
ncbi:MAG: hypothetical protein AVDCRST_MAG05-760, partial [uncultured Rubrobacteraceae bacterium]